MEPDSFFEDAREQVELWLSDFTTGNSRLAECFSELYRYTVLAGGKRLRPLCVLELGRLRGVEGSRLRSAAVGVELVHASSLIHDDLPALDNSDVRRGCPSAHRAFGQDSALLGGNYLNSLALEIVLSAPELPVEARVVLGERLAEAVSEVNQGQMLERRVSEASNPVLDDIELVYSKKTGALFSFACSASAAIDGNGSAARSLAEAGRLLGVLFQMADDLDDYRETKEEGSLNIVALFGRDTAVRLISDRLTTLTTVFEGSGIGRAETERIVRLVLGQKANSTLAGNLSLS